MAYKDIDAVMLAQRAGGRGARAETSRLRKRLNRMIELDGAQGRRRANPAQRVTLSMITGQPFRMINIRAKRPKPGLMRQHLAAVQAAASISGAEVSGAEAGSQALQFAPGAIRGGDYAFAIGTAGSCTLVLQTLLPALLAADAPSTVKISGGTHNAMAPPVHFLQRAYGCVLRRWVRRSTSR
jgi:RNA 3'-terminal phosphate cyclase (ATP)